MKSFYQKKCSSRGFTLVEMLVALSIFTILSLVIMQSISSFYRFNAYTLAQAYEVNSARRGVELLVRDLREMIFADDGTFPLSVMEEEKIGFYSDIDHDQSVEYVEYELSSTTLIKSIYSATGSPPVYNLSVPESVHTVSEYVQNGLDSTPLFYYYDANGSLATATTTITDIRYVETVIIVNIDPLRNPGQFMLRSSAALRNLKNTL